MKLGHGLLYNIVAVLYTSYLGSHSRTYGRDVYQSKHIRTALQIRIIISSRVTRLAGVSFINLGPMMTYLNKMLDLFL